jgi:hypothetical protein
MSMIKKLFSILLLFLLFLASAIIVLGIFNYILYGEFFSTVYCASPGPGDVIGHVINQDLLWARLTYSQPAPGVNYDITNIDVFLNLVNNNPVEYIVTQENGVHIQAIRFNNFNYTVNPTVVKGAIMSGNFNFHWY